MKLNEMLKRVFAHRRTRVGLGLGASLLLLLGAVLMIPNLGSTPATASYAVVIATPIPQGTSSVPAGVYTYDVIGTNTATYNYAGGFVILSTCSSGTCNNTYDDGIKLTVTRPNQTQAVAEFRFYAQPFPPIDVTSLFMPGNNTVYVELLDLMGPVYGSNITFYLVAAASAPPNALRVEPVPLGMQYVWQVYSAYSNDPVHTLTGSFTYAFTDVSTTGRGPSPMFARAYNSADTRDGPMGRGWTHSYNIRLVAPAAGSPDVVLVGPQGQSDLYTANGDGTYAPPTGVHTTLVKNGDTTYTATHKNQTKWVFNALGQLIRIEDRFGNISFLSYNADELLESVSDPAARGNVTLGYTSGKLTSVRDWMNPQREVRYQYDASGRLWKVTDREGKVTTFAYDGSTQRLTTITDAEGHVAVTNSYDAQGRVATQKDARGLVTGQQTTFAYNTNGDGSKTTVMTYPRTSFEQSWNHTEEDTYDTQGRNVKHLSKPTSNTAEWVTQEYTWDGESNRTSMKDGRGNTTQYCYDVDYAGVAIPGSHGNLTRQIEPSAEAGANRAVTLFRYDSKDNLLQTVSPKGVSSGTNVTCTTNLSGALNTNYSADMGYDSATQTKLLSTTRRYTDPETGAQVAVTKYEYGDSNNAGRITKVIPPRGNTGPNPDYSYATTLEYFVGGNKAGLLRRETDANGNSTTHDYDVVGRELSMVDPNGYASGGVPSQHTWRYVYDGEDRVRFVIAPAPTASGAPLVTESRYDGVGNLVVKIDANGQVTKNLYDERDSLKEVQESPNSWTDPNVTPAGLIRAEYQYDDLGNMSRATRAKADAANERATDYVYDGLGRVRREMQYPAWPSTSGALITEFTFDKNSNRQTLRDPLNKVTTFGYDARNLPRSMTYSDGITPNVQYSYDLNGNRVSMVDGTGTTSYTQDELDRMLSVTSPSDAGPKTVGYRYDLDGNERKLIYPEGRAVSYTFDRGGRIQALTDWVNRSVAYGYFADSNLKSITNPNGTSTDYSYDNAQRLTDVLNKAGSNTISRHTYTMDAAGNRTRADEVLPENGVPRLPDARRQSATLYGYDRLYRLTSENGPDVAAAYSYDSVGNRSRMVKGRDDVTYAYDRADRITRMGSDNVTVDAAGNMVARGNQTYTYDQANRLVQSRMPQPTQYIYDGDGKRVTTDVGQGPLTTHVYDVNRSLPVLLFDGRRTYVWGVGLAFAVDGNGTMETYHSDGLGSVRAVTFPNGNVTENYQSDAFGVVVRRQGTSNQPFQYAGQERDKETGFSYLRARYYDPSMGRFIQRDTFGGMTSRPLSTNRYSYVENNPINSVDPSGLYRSRALRYGTGCGINMSCVQRTGCGYNMSCAAPGTFSVPYPVPGPTPTVRRYYGNPFAFLGSPRVTTTALGAFGVFEGAAIFLEGVAYGGESVYVGMDPTRAVGLISYGAFTFAEGLANIVIGGLTGGQPIDLKESACRAILHVGDCGTNLIPIP